MEFITVQQAANNFGVNVRTIQKWAKEGKLLGAKRVGRVWLIPDDAVLKIENETDNSNEASCGMPLKLMCSSFVAGSAHEVIEKIEIPKCKLFAEAEYHYLRGESEKCADILEHFLSDENDEISYPAAFLYAFANLLLRKPLIAKISLSDLKDYMKDDRKMHNVTKDNVSSVFVATIAGVLLRLKPTEISDIKELLKFLPEGARMFMAYVLANSACMKKDYSKAIGIVEGAFSVSSEFYPVPTIYLNIVASIAYIHLKQIEKAKKAFYYALDIALPDGFIEPFVEHHGLFLGLVEVCMREKYPVYFKRVVSAVEQFYPHWLKVRDEDDIRHIPYELTATEFIVAMLFDRGWSMKEISSYLGLSLRMVKYYVATVYDKLGITRREELKHYMLK